MRCKKQVIILGKKLLSVRPEMAVFFTISASNFTTQDMQSLPALKILDPLDLAKNPHYWKETT
jgi:hypothetical protein